MINTLIKITNVFQSKIILEVENYEQATIEERYEMIEFLKTGGRYEKKLYTYYNCNACHHCFNGYCYINDA